MTDPGTPDVMERLQLAAAHAKSRNDAYAIGDAQNEILSLRSRLEKMETALRKAVANLQHVSVYDDADDDDPDAVSAREAWQRDLESIRAALQDKETGK